MGIYYSHNLIRTSIKADKTVKMIGACGEILLRPYIVRKYFETHLMDIDNEKDFLDYILRDYSADIIVGYDAAKEFISLHLEELSNYGNCSMLEKIDRIYLEHRHGYHFDQGINSKYSLNNVMPLQSKELFKIHHNIYDDEKSIKLQLDVMNMLEPYLAAVEYESNKDNEDKKAIKDELLFEKNYQRNINLQVLDNSKEKYDSGMRIKQKNTKVIGNNILKEENINIYQRCLYGLQYLCKYSEKIRENVGIALYYYINTHKEEKYAKNLRFMYNKIFSLKDQIDIFEE